MASTRENNSFILGNGVEDFALEPKSFEVDGLKSFYSVIAGSRSRVGAEEFTRLDAGK